MLFPLIQSSFALSMQNPVPEPSSPEFLKPAQLSLPADSPSDPPSSEQQDPFVVLKPHLDDTTARLQVYNSAECLLN